MYNPHQRRTGHRVDLTSRPSVTFALNVGPSGHRAATPSPEARRRAAKHRTGELPLEANWAWSDGSVTGRILDAATSYVTILHIVSTSSGVFCCGRAPVSMLIELPTSCLTAGGGRGPSA